MRGKVVYDGPADADPGITPACAGKRHVERLRFALSGDHPRVCGEKLATGAAKVGGWGSPPRVRGKDAIQRHPSRGFGITPACAGKSKAQTVKMMWLRDHPRVCGEKVFCPSQGWKNGGSPPRVRGKAASRAAPCVRAGITPACAGKRLKRSHSIGHFSCILCLFHSVLHRASVSGGSRAGPCAPPCLPAQNAVPV